jgi:hypothetical protein
MKMAMKLTIERKECFSEGQTKVLEIFKDLSNLDSLFNSLKAMRFVASCFLIKRHENQLWIIPNYGDDRRRAAVFEETDSIENSVQPDNITNHFHNN